MAKTLVRVDSKRRSEASNNSNKNIYTELAKIVGATAPLVPAPLEKSSMHV